MLNISNQSDYGILFISYLFEKKEHISLGEIIKKTGMPKRFLARIAAELVRYKIVSSREGKIGGYQLTKKIYQISLYDYLRIFEKNLNLTKCQLKNYQCKWEQICRHKSFLKNKLRKILIKKLKNYKLIDIF